MGEDDEEDRTMDGGGTGDTVMGGGEEREAPDDLPRDSKDPEGDGRRFHKDIKEEATWSGGPCNCRYVDFIIGSYPKVGKGTIIQRIDGTMDAKDNGGPGDQGGKTGNPESRPRTMAGSGPMDLLYGSRPSVSRTSVWTCLGRKEEWRPPTKSSMTCGQYLSNWNVESCG